jgi:hypothetical protein
MSRRKDVGLNTRNEAIRKSVVAGESPIAVAQRYGLDNAYVYRMLRRMKVDLSKVKSDADSPESKRAISNLHVRIGQTISAFRIFNKKMTISEFGAHVRLSLTKLGQLEQGTFDPTLGQLQRIAEACGTDLSGLLLKKPGQTIGKRHGTN